MTLKDDVSELGMEIDNILFELLPFVQGQVQAVAMALSHLAAHLNPSEFAQYTVVLQLEQARFEAKAIDDVEGESLDERHARLMVSGTITQLRALREMILIAHSEPPMDGDLNGPTLHEGD